MNNVIETVSLDQIKDKYGNYLTRTINKKPQITNTKSSSNGEILQLIETVKKEIIKLDYRDIDFLYIGHTELNLETYEIVLPDEIEADVKKIISLLENEYSDDAAQSWYFQIDSKGELYFNRIHFNNGLPFELRGTGFGFKIYKAFITIKGFASSAMDASTDAKRVWIKLVQESDFECVINDKVLLILNKKVYNKLLLTKQFIEFNEIKLNSYKTVISETLLKEIKPYISYKLGGDSKEDYIPQEIPTANNNLEIGEDVFIFDIDENLIKNNESLALKLGAEHWVKGLNDLEEYDVVTVFNLTFNQGENVALVYCERTDKEYLVNVEGLEKYHEPDMEMNK